MNMISDQTAADMIGTRVNDVSLAVLRESPDCIKRLNADGRISFMNENGMCAMDIADADEIAGKTWWDLWPEAERAPLKRAFEMSLAGKVTMYQGQCPTGAGTLKDWDVRITPIINDDGQITSVLAISRDVTA